MSCPTREYTHEHLQSPLHIAPPSLATLASLWRRRRRVARQQACSQWNRSTPAGKSSFVKPSTCPTAGTRGLFSVPPRISMHSTPHCVRSTPQPPKAHLSIVDRLDHSFRSNLARRRHLAHSSQRGCAPGPRAPQGRDQVPTTRFSPEALRSHRWPRTCCSPIHYRRQAARCAEERLRDTSQAARPSSGEPALQGGRTQVNEISEEQAWVSAGGVSSTAR
jgi:hypothetical protein